MSVSGSQSADPDRRPLLAATIAALAGMAAVTAPAAAAQTLNGIACVSGGSRCLAFGLTQVGAAAIVASW
jgi:hypothetical protein